MEGQLRITECGFHNGVFSDATTSHCIDGSWFDNPEDIKAMIDGEQEKSTHIEATWVDKNGIEYSPDEL